MDSVSSAPAGTPIFPGRVIAQDNSVPIRWGGGLCPGRETHLPEPSSDRPVTRRPNLPLPPWPGSLHRQLMDSAGFTPAGTSQ